MSPKGSQKGIRFEVDKANLYREESYTDLKSATVRKLIPVKIDGSEDPEREVLYVGHADLISPSGPIPIQAELGADSLEAALIALPGAMERAAVEVRDEYNRAMQQQQEQGSKVIKSDGSS